MAELLKHCDLNDKPLTVALQGFGNVGYFFAKVLKAELPHVRLIAVSNSKNTWLKPDGIDVDTVDAQSATPRPEHLGDLQGISTLPAQAIISVKADILVLAALEDSITQTNMHEVKAGGVIVSCLEWQQNLLGEHWPEDKVNATLASILVPATNAMLQYAQDKKVSLKQAAFELALKRLLQEQQQHGKVVD